LCLLAASCALLPCSAKSAIGTYHHTCITQVFYLALFGCNMPHAAKRAKQN
jgi:hypothetical protein